MNSHRNVSRSDETIEVRIEKLVYGGEGLARIDGRVVLTPFVLPGELVQIQTGKSIHARTVKVQENAPQRVQPGCPYFYRCGGCHLQHASYEEQLVQKLEMLRDVMRRVGKLEAPDRIEVVSAEPWGYRNRVQLHIEGNAIGYRAMGSHKLVPVDHCPISSPRINEVIAILSRMVRSPKFPRFLQSIEIFTNEAEVQVNVIETRQAVARRFFDWCAESIPGYVPAALQYGAYRVGRKSFFQVNRFLIDRLIDTALEGAEGEAALDLFAGVGLFSIPLARKFAGVTAVESGGTAIDDLVFNSQEAALAVAAVKRDALEFLQSDTAQYDLILADPPRAGLGPQMVDELIRLRPRRLTIISCDPSTLARDLQPLLASGFSMESMTLIDLFPQTYHLETIVRLNGY